FLGRYQRAPNDYKVIHGLQEVYYKWGKWPQALEWSTRAAALRPSDAEAHYGVGTFIWQVLAAHGGGPDMAVYDPRPRPAPEDTPDAGLKRGKRADRAWTERGCAARSPSRGGLGTLSGSPCELSPPPPAPPPTLAGDVTGKARVDLADQAIAHLEKAVALRP